MHEVTQGVEGLGLPVHRGVGGLLVDRGPIAGVLDVQRLEVVHGPGHQITWKVMFRHESGACKIILFTY